MGRRVVTRLIVAAMPLWSRCLVLICCFSLTGCTAVLTTTTSASGQHDRSAMMDPPPEELPMGHNVRVELLDGDSVRGELMEHDEAARTLELVARGDVGASAHVRVVPVDSVRSLHWESREEAKKSLVLGLGLDLVLGLIITYLAVGFATGLGGSS